MVGYFVKLIFTKPASATKIYSPLFYHVKIEIMMFGILIITSKINLVGAHNGSIKHNAPNQFSLIILSMPSNQTRSMKKTIVLHLIHCIYWNHPIS